MSLIEEMDCFFVTRNIILVFSKKSID
ncbi:hypothetical protein JOC48_003422 [Aquibacillus albus]|uniref:Uncharacterized protein n=1 Tax=Aquibacillus albus TaxID=1168171 RepID=A0ABS2N425_9BACI|nr:hypothetical protein [Aquibacillus albus]